MENKLYALEQLYLNLRLFFGEHVVPPIVFKKHTADKRVEISSYLGTRAYFVNKADSFQDRLLEEVLIGLKALSQYWILPLSEISTFSDYLGLKISRQHAFRSVITQIFNANGQYGDRPALNLKASVRCVPERPNNLTELRLLLLAKVYRNLLACAGYEIVQDSDDADIRLQTSTQDAVSSVKCGHVVDTDGERCDISVKDYHRLREQDIRVITEHKYWEEEREDVIKNLAAAAVTMDLLRSKANTSVKLIMKQDVAIGSRDEGSRGAAFILYNSARVASIHRKFEEGVEKGTYPPLPPFEDIDTTLLVQEEEWQLLFDYLLEYPQLLQMVVVNAAKKDIRHHLVCNFLFKLTQLFSTYYCRHKFLAEPKPHLLPKMYARLTLSKAVDEVMKHAFQILDIQVVDYM